MTLLGVMSLIGNRTRKCDCILIFPQLQTLLCIYTRPNYLSNTDLLLLKNVKNAQNLHFQVLLMNFLCDGKK
jgi:hypothetical protein